MALNTLGKAMEFSIAENGQVAIELLNKETSFSPAYIFIDVNMPKMNGLECLKYIRTIQRLNTSYVYMYSTSADAHIVEACKQLGADDFIKKPASLDALVLVLQRLIT